MMARVRGEGSIEKLPSGSFRARVSRVVNGELLRSSKTFERRGDAAEWLRAQSGPAAAGTLGEWLDAWLDLRKPDVAAKTDAGDRDAVGRLVRPHLGPVRLRDLTGLAVAQWLARLAGEGVSDSERKKAGAVLRKSLRDAVAHGQLPADPMQGIRLPSPVRPEKRAMTPDQLRAWLLAARPRGAEHLYRLWADAGLRPAEVYALDWSDFDLAAGTVRVSRAVCGITRQVKEPKTRGSRRTVRLAPSTVAALVAARPVGGGLFLPAGRGGPYWESNFIAYAMQPVRNAAGMLWVVPYTFRHTMATLLLRKGVPLKVVSERLGHAQVTTTLAHYAHVLEGDQERAAAAMEEVLNPAAHAGPTPLPGAGNETTQGP